MSVNEFETIKGLIFVFFIRLSFAANSLGLIKVLLAEALRNLYLSMHTDITKSTIQEFCELEI